MTIDPPPIKAPDKVRILGPDFFARLLTTVRLLWFNFDLRSYTELTGTSASTQGGTTSITHGVDSSKIISVSAVVYPTSTTGVPQNTSIAGYEFALSFDATNVVVTNSAANSSNILSKSLSVFIVVRK